VGGDDSGLASLADTIAAVRRELSLAQAAGQGQAVQFRAGPVELEFEVAVTRTGGGQAGVQLWVLPGLSTAMTPAKHRLWILVRDNGPLSLIDQGAWCCPV
jgi:Trypsin-co-occurring domain 2